MANNERLSARIIGQIALMQSVVVQLPDDKSILNFSCQGLKDIPGITEIGYNKNSISIGDKVFNNSTKRIFHIVHKQKTHFNLVVSINDFVSFEPYVPYMQNYCNILALLLEANRAIDNLSLPLGKTKKKTL